MNFYLLQTYRVTYYPVLTIGIIVFTVVFSFWCFDREDRLNKYSFMPYQIKHYREHYRFLSHAFIHADIPHLLFNMLGLYFFGSILEPHFAVSEKFGFVGGEAIFLLLYTSSMYAAVIPQQLKLKDDRSYASLGASGAVNAVLFGFIMIDPTARLSLLFLPKPGIPAWIFGIVYLGISFYLSKRKSSNPMVARINHEAHFWGAFYGVIFMSAFEPNLVVNFYHQTIGKLFGH